MARSMACELGQYGIRCNSLSPGHIRTNLVAKFLDEKPEQEEKWAECAFVSVSKPFAFWLIRIVSLNPMHRIGKVHEVRGPCVWLASDASSYVVRVLIPVHHPKYSTSFSRLAPISSAMAATTRGKNLVPRSCQSVQ